MQDDAIAPDGQSSVVERRLATILMADVFGYSRMMGEDEERTVRTLRGHRAVFDELLKVHRGRIFNTAGDSILAEFPSAVEAVRCATEIQAALRTRNEHLPEEQRMWFRIGINLGDVIVQGGDLLGDGVNVAARIQTIAEPGGVCISGSVYDQIRNKLTLQIKQLGERSFKNIAQPVRTFSISDDDGSPRPAVAHWRRDGNGRMVAQAGIAALVIALVGGGYWLYSDLGQKAAEQTRRAEEAQRAAELQRKSEQDQATAAMAQKEAKLLAELQSTKDALTQAEAAKRKVEQDRVAAEAAQREARIQSELKAAKEALVKAEQSSRAAEEARQAAAAAEAAAIAARKAGDGARRKAAPTAGTGGTAKADAETRSATQVASTAATAATGNAAAAKGIARFDGVHSGRMCSINADRSPRCWNVTLTVQQGSLSASWPGRFSNEPSHAKGTMAADGSVNMAIDGHGPNGQALTGTANGTVAGKKLTVSGQWSNNAPINGTWMLNQ